MVISPFTQSQSTLGSYSPEMTSSLVALKLLCGTKRASEEDSVGKFWQSEPCFRLSRSEIRNKKVDLDLAGFLEAHRDDIKRHEEILSGRPSLPPELSLTNAVVNSAPEYFLGKGEHK